MLFCAFVPFSFFFSCALSFVFFLIRLLLDFIRFGYMHSKDACPSAHANDNNILLFGDAAVANVLRPMLMVTVSYSSEIHILYGKSAGLSYGSHWRRGLCFSYSFFSHRLDASCRDFRGHEGGFGDMIATSIRCFFS